VPRSPPFRMMRFNRCPGNLGLPAYFNVQGAVGIKCCIDAQNHVSPTPRVAVYHLNLSEAPENEPRVATLTMTIPFPLQEALKDSITSGTFVDTKFWVFSKRTSKPGRVGEPKPLFVNAHVAKRVPRLASRTLTSFIQVTSR